MSKHAIAETAQKLAALALKEGYAKGAMAIRSAPEKIISTAKSEATTLVTNLLITPLKATIVTTKTAVKYSPLVAIGTAIYNGATKELPSEEAAAQMKSYTEIPSIGETVNDCISCIKNASEQILTLDLEAAKQALEDSDYADRADRLSPILSTLVQASRGSENEMAQKVQEYSAALSRQGTLLIPTIIFGTSKNLTEILAKPATTRIENSIMQARAVGHKLSKEAKKITAAATTENKNKTSLTHEPRRQIHRRTTGQIIR